MANYKLRSQFNFGDYKGYKVKDVIKLREGRKFIHWLHNSRYNVKFTDEVFDEMQNILMQGCKDGANDSEQ